MAFTFLLTDGVVGNANVATVSIDSSGAALLVVAATYLDVVGTPTISDSNANTYTPTSVTGDGAPNATRIWYCINPAVGVAHAISATGTGTRPTIAVVAYSATGGGVLFDDATASSGVTPGAITPSEDGGLLVCGIGCPAEESPADTVTGGFGTRVVLSQFGGPGLGISLADLIQTSAASANPTWSGGSSASDGVVMGAFVQEVGPVDTPLDGAAAAVVIAASPATLHQVEVGAAAAVVIGGSVATLHQVEVGAAAAVVIAASPATLHQVEVGAAAAVVIGGSVAVLAQVEPGAAAAVVIGGSVATLTGGMPAAVAAVTVTSAPAALRAGTVGSSAAVTVTSAPAALRAATVGSSAAVTVTSAPAALQRSAPTPAGRVAVVGSPARLVALSPIPPTPPPAPPPVYAPRPGRRPRRRPGTRVLDSIPPVAGGDSPPPLAGL